MSDAATADLEQLGRDAARQVAGDAAVEQVEVVEGESFDRAVYRFSFLIDQDRALLRRGLMYSRIVQALSDALIARNDAHYPVITLLDREDWDKRTRA
jgi:hypothetical protein